MNFNAWTGSAKSDCRRQGLSPARNPLWTWVVALGLAGCGARPPAPTSTRETPLSAPDEAHEPVDGESRALDTAPALAALEIALAAAAEGDCEPATRLAQDDNAARPTRAEAWLAVARCASGADALTALARAVDLDVSRQAEAEAQLATLLSSASREDRASAIGAFTGGALASALAESLLSDGGPPDAITLRALTLLDAADPRAAKVLAELQRVHLAVLLPVTGRSRPLGLRLAETVAALGRDADDPDAPPRLQVVDSGAADGVEAALKSLASSGPLHGAVGMVDQASAERVSRALVQAKLPAVLMTLSDAPLNAGPTQWRALHTPSLVARTAAGVALARGGRRAVVLRPDSAYHATLSRVFFQAWVAGGGEAIGEVAWPTKAPDWKKVAAQVSGAGADTLFIPCESLDAAQLLSHLAAAGIWARGESSRFNKRDGVQELLVVGSPEWYTPSLLTQAGRYVEGALVPVPFAVETEGGTRLVERLGPDFGRLPTAFDALLVDAVEAFSRARHIELAEGISRSEALSRVQLSDGATAGLFLEGREAVSRLFVVTVSGGRFVPLP